MIGSPSCITGHMTMGVCIQGVVMGSASRGVGQTPPPSDTMGYGQQAGSMHPTGMHSCCIIF